MAESRQAVGLQGAGPNAKHAAPPRLPPGRGKATHMQFAACLPNPCDTAAQLDDDSMFAYWGMCTLGPLGPCVSELGDNSSSGLSSVCLVLVAVGHCPLQAAPAPIRLCRSSRPACARGQEQGLAMPASFCFWC